MTHYSPNLVLRCILTPFLCLHFLAATLFAEDSSYESLQEQVTQIVTINSVSGNNNALQYTDENEVTAKLTQALKASPEDSRSHTLGAQLAQVLIDGKRFDEAANLLKLSQPLATRLEGQDFSSIPNEDAIFLPLYQKTNRKLAEARTPSPMKEGTPLTEAEVDALVKQLEELNLKVKQLQHKMYREKGAIEEAEAILAEAKPIADRLQPAVDKGIGYSMRAVYGYEGIVESVEDIKTAVKRQGGPGVPTRANRPGLPRPQR